MKFLTLLGVELKKLKRSKICLILLIPAVLLWIPSVMNADLNFGMQAEGISPEHNFFIQGYLAMTWFMFPASIVVCTVLLSQTEQNNRGILKMLSLPVHTAWLCLAKFCVLLALAAVHILMMTAMYYAAAAIASRAQNYDFVLPPSFLMGRVGEICLSAVPMLAVFFMLSVCIQKPVFSIGTGLFSIVPSVLIINTKAWFAWPPAYPLFIVTSEYGRLAGNLTTRDIQWLPWIPTAILITLLSLAVSCIRFGADYKI
ncbi:MAG: ABC transporter permease [Muribaculaceae bacterium]|nr:ABC transporter permease [Roseburia sp.]MCM1430644.1 ABC transporter permease [Muribaculaceae bacterium]MCM1491911.1 ABC transporter permease [Muribaculaceae bacterium]